MTASNGKLENWVQIWVCFIHLRSNILGRSSINPPLLVFGNPTSKKGPSQIERKKKNLKKTITNVAICNHFTLTSLKPCNLSSQKYLTLAAPIAYQENWLRGDWLNENFVKLLSYNQRWGKNNLKKYFIKKLWSQQLTCHSQTSHENSAATCM